MKTTIVTRLFESPALKSWQAEQAAPLRRALAVAVAALRADKPLVLDLLVDMEAEMLEPLVDAMTVLHWRSRPSKEFGARVRRMLGFYSGESTLAAAVVIDSAEQLESLLRSDLIWDCEFTIYPQPARPLAELPDPHFDMTAFAAEITWSLSQDSGSDAWLVTGLEVSTVDAVCSALERAFSSQALTSSMAPGPSL